MIAFYSIVYFVYKLVKPKTPKIIDNNIRNKLILYVEFSKELTDRDDK